MGLFDKTVKCQKCGKEFTKSRLSGDKLCPQCSWVELFRQMQANARDHEREGITQYYKDMPKKFRQMPADVDTIIAARNQMLQRHMRPDPMNISLLRNALTSCPEWSHDQMVNFAGNVLNATVNTQNRMSFVLGRFVISHLYDGVAVDADSVFAIGLTQNIFYKASIKEQPYLCALFTNDPYFPVIGMTFLPKTTKSFLAMERSKNKERVAALQEILPKMFPHLTYPVMDMKEMKKLVKQEGTVRGNMNPELMIELLGNGVSSPFWAIDSAMPENMPSGIAMAIQNYGYISQADVFNWMGLDDAGLRAAWAPCFNEAAQQLAEIEDELRAYIQTNPEAFAEHGFVTVNY